MSVLNVQRYKHRAGEFKQPRKAAGVGGGTAAGVAEPSELLAVKSSRWPKRHVLESAMEVAMQTPRSGQSAMLTPPRPQKGQFQNPIHHPKGKFLYLPKAIGLL